MSEQTVSDRQMPRRAPHITRWSTAHPVLAIITWVVFIAAAVVVGGSVGTHSVDSRSAPGDAGKAERLIKNAGFPEDLAAERALIVRTDGAPLTEADRSAAAAAITHELESVPHVENLSSEPLISSDGRAALMQWDISGDPETADQRVQPMIDAVARAGESTPGLTMGEVGDGSLNQAISNMYGDDLQQSEILSIPLTLLILIIVFGAVVAALVPLVLALTSLVAAFAITQALTPLVAWDETTGSVMLVIGLAVGVDYALFIVRRARNERYEGRDSREAILAAAATSGRAVIISGITVVIAVAGMLFAGDPTFRSMAVGCMVAVGTALLGSMIALPAVLSLLGDRVDTLRVPWLARHRRETHGDNRFWGAVVRRSTRRPGVTVAVVGGIMLVAASPILGLNTKLSDLQDLPRSIPEMQTIDALHESFPAEGGVHRVVIRTTTGVDSPDVKEAVDDMVVALRRTPGIAPDWTPTPEYSPNREAMILDVPYLGDDTASGATGSLTALRHTIIPNTVGKVADVRVTGDAAGSHDFTNLITERLPLIMAFVIGLTIVLMILAFRSPWLAGMTAMLNLLSVGVAYGLLVTIFQHDWFDGLLGIETTGSIIAWLPLFLFVVLFGLSMDYHVFVLSRIREAITGGATPDEAISIGIRQTASVITSAAVIMIGAFSMFAFLSTLDMKQMGIGLALAIAVDATIVRGVMLPAALKLLGERAWREPAWTRRLPHLGESAPPPQPVAT